jgi:multiple sugar transport system ATP-binding protein
MVFVTHDQVEAMTLADRIVVMNGGRIDQVGAPMDIYQKPRTKFVAGFVGSPAMNFLPVARVPDEQGRVVVRLHGGELLYTQVAASGALGHELCIGVRPEGLKMTEAGTLAGRVELIERLGERSLAHVGLEDGTVVVAEVPVQRALALGDVVRLQPDLAQLHAFDVDGLAHHAESAEVAAA